MGESERKNLFQIARDAVEVTYHKLHHFLTKEITINTAKPRTVWVAIIEVKISQLGGQRKIAIVMNAPFLEDADDLDYLITNVESELVTEQ